MVTHPDAAASGTVQLLWGLREGPTRGPKPVLSIERIAAAAVAIADADGLAALSMQRVAKELDFTKMSLYRYVTGKDELVAAMIDLAVGVPPDPAAMSGAGHGWRHRLEEWLQLLADTWRAHPWLPWATMGDRVMGPNEVGWIESAVAILDDTGLTASERMSVVLLLCGHIRNTQSTSAAGTQPWTSGQQLNILRAHGDRFPVLVAMADDGDEPPDDNARAFGIRCILDGIESLIAQRSA